MRTKWSLAALIGVLLATLGQSGGIAQESTAAQDPQAELQQEGALFFEFSQAELSRIVRGYQIAPVPLNLHGKDLELVGLGSYIVNAVGG